MIKKNKKVKKTRKYGGCLKGDTRRLFSKYGTMKGKPSIWGVIRIILVKPGVQALIFYRFYHLLYRIKLCLLAEILCRINIFFNGAELDPGAEIGSGCRIWHSAGVIVGRGVKIGNNVSLFSNAVLGGVGHSIFHHGEPGYPVIGDNVIIYSNVTIAGPVKIGNNSTIGANSVVLNSIPDNCMAAGCPAKVIKRL
ncbi:MAG: DapH/DapD/GlmU-related protein [Actinomycetota bacterium]|nr:DapH/DapD/GlmU-related protein [Actinomycetota bacterium]